MTEQKAKEYLEHMLNMMGSEPPVNLTDERDIKEWEDEHKNIRETLELSLVAVEKQIHMQHHHTRIDRINDELRVSVCPACLGLIYTFKTEYPKFCVRCGQKIGWEE